MDNKQMGFVVFAEELADKFASQVKAAADECGFEKSVHEVSDRSAFIRASRQLVRDGVVQVEGDNVLRDKFKDDADVISFQFSERHLLTVGVDYQQAHVVTFDKKTGEVTCADENVRNAARALCNKLKGICTATDINSLVRRVVETECKRVALRDAVYFIPVSRRDLVLKLEKFYSLIGFHLTVLPVGMQDGQRSNIMKSACRELRDNIKRVGEEIAELQADDKLTPRIARNRLKELQTELTQYTELAQALNTDMKDLLDGAGETAQALVQAAMPVDSLIAAVQQGTKLSPLVLELLSADEDNKQAVEALNVASQVQDVDLPNSASAVKVKAAIPVEPGMVDLVGSTKKGG